MVWRLCGAAWSPKPGLELARGHLVMGLLQLLQNHWVSGRSRPVTTFKWLWKCELFFSASCVSPSAFDSEKVCIASKPFMRNLSCKPIRRHRILLL